MYSRVLISGSRVYIFIILISSWNGECTENAGGCNNLGSTLECSGKLLLFFPEHKVTEDIEYINVSWNLIEGLDPILKGVNVKALNLSFNQLTHIDKDFFKNLQNLKVLDLRGNHITKLPEDLGTSLRTLYLSENKLQNLPRLPRSLEVLEASSNKIRDIPSSLSELPNLITLELSSNMISNIPCWSSTSLIRLDVSNCPLSEICPTLNLTSLQYLDLSWTSLTAASYTSDSLKSLKIQEAKLTQFSLICPQLETLNISGNALQSFPDGFFSYNPSIGELFITGNKWTCDCDTLHLLEGIVFHEIICFPQGTNDHISWEAYCSPPYFYFFWVFLAMCLVPLIVLVTVFWLRSRSGQYSLARNPSKGDLKPSPV